MRWEFLEIFTFLFQSFLQKVLESSCKGVSQFQALGYFTEGLFSFKDKNILLMKFKKYLR